MILVVIAMKEEADIILKNPKSDVKVILTGVGKVNAASALTEAIIKYPITHILNLGFAGATADFNIGDVVHIKEALYHDFDLTLFGYSKGQVPGFPPSFTMSSGWIIDPLSNGWKTSTLLTGDYFQTRHPEQSCLFDMEGAALFQVAYRYQLPLLSIKVVSDVIGAPEHMASYRKFEASEGAIRLYEVYEKLLGGV